MLISRELAIEEMEQTIEILERLIDELKRPRTVNSQGLETDEFPDGIPPQLSVSEIRSISPQQMRADLSVASSKLEAIAST